jgi:DNA (cytosine-5)-methyltransferase 1
MSFTHIDCFSGPGGICTGFHAAGLKTLIAIEYIKSCVETYSANHPEVHVIQSDIRDVMAEQLLPFIPKDGVDIITSGMPCETFSNAGSTSRSFYDDRQFLFREGIRIAKIANAKLILFENVPAITTKRVSKDSSKLIVNMLKSELREAGYGNYVEVVLDSSQYGVPQRRKRFFILACKFPEWKLSYPQVTAKQPVTVFDAFAELPNVIPNSNIEATEYEGKPSEYSKLMRNNKFWRLSEDKCEQISYQMPMKHRAGTLERFSLLKQGENVKNLFDRFTDDEREILQARGVLPRKIFYNRYYRLVPQSVAPTVTSHCLDEFVHPEYDRALTVRECARLQSFPDKYIFSGPYGSPHNIRDVQDKYEQIGDAVPPLLAYAWGNQIEQILEENKNATENQRVLL